MAAHARLQSGVSSPLIGKFKLPQKAWEWINYQAISRKKRAFLLLEFCNLEWSEWLGYLQKMCFSFSFITNNWSSCASKLFRNLPCLWFCWTRNFAKNIQFRCAASLGVKNGGGFEDLWEPLTLTHRKADLVLNVFNQQSIRKMNVTNLNNVMCQYHTKFKTK